MKNSVNRWITLLIALGLMVVLTGGAVWKPGGRQAGKKSPPTRTTKKPASPQAASIEFVQIPAGEFLMGSDNGEEEDEQPAHRVTISHPFELGKYEVTQAQWQAVMGSIPSAFKGCGNCPVEKVSWNDVQKFLRRMNGSNDGHFYRLPTEAEWEYACRAGTTGDYAGNLDEMAWYEMNSGLKTHPVGQKRPNAWGLYDMHGNVLELCQDWHNDNYYKQSPKADPKGPGTGSHRVIRGGSWFDTANECRSASRNGVEPSVRDAPFGFRLVRTSN